MPTLQKITPFLSFQNQAEEAARFYVSVFKQSKIVDIHRYDDAGPGPKGAVMAVKFRILGENFISLNGGPDVPFTAATSFVINCTTQQEVDYYWRKLPAGGGKTICCGWLEDKFGVTWQVVPTLFLELLGHKDPAVRSRMMTAMMKMTKLDIAKIKQAIAEPSSRRGKAARRR